MEESVKKIASIAKAKSMHRRQRALLPFPEKIRILVELQKRRAPIMALRGIKQRIWRLPQPTEDK